MNRNLPPFPAVRAFEAAARHLSFKGAAAELHVTPSAISHQIKALERYLGQPLFLRNWDGIALTDAGSAYLPAIGEALDRIHGCTERIRQQNVSGSLDIVTTPAFAARWLVARLGAFRDAYPELEVRLTTSLRGVDFERKGADVAVWYGQGAEPGLRTDTVMRSALYPVCSPKLLRGTRPLRTVHDVRGHTLLHADAGDAWSRWLRRAGVQDADTGFGIRFEDCNLMIEAAIECQGIALAFKALVARDIEQGRLACPFGLPLEPASGYYVVSPEEWAERPKIRSFRDWILRAATDEMVTQAAE